MEYYSEIFLKDGTSKILGKMHLSIKEAQNEAARHLKENHLCCYKGQTDPVAYVQIKKRYKGGRSGVHDNYRYEPMQCIGNQILGGYFRKIK